MKLPLKALKWGGIAVGVFVIVIAIATVWWTRTTIWQLEQKLSTLHEAGEPLSLADLARQPIPAEQNADTYLRLAQGDIIEIDWELTNLANYKFIQRLLPEELNKVGSTLDAYPKVIPLLQQAADCPDYDFAFDYSDPDAVRTTDAKLQDIFILFRATSKILWAKTQLQLSEKDKDEALRFALMTFKLARHCGRNPTGYGHAMGVGVRRWAIESANLVLQSGSVSQEMHQVLDAELEIDERMDSFIFSMKTERAYDMDDIRRRRSGNIFSNVLWNIMESQELDIIQIYINQSANPSPYNQAQWIIEQNKRSISMSFLTKSYSNYIKNSYERALQMQALIRSLRVLNALQTHAPAQGNEVPKLSDLGLPTETTTDPYTGEPLHVKRVPEGWLVYAVGLNFEDDGGNLADNLDVGIAPPVAAVVPSVESGDQ
jgi:hypothetical protein